MMQLGIRERASFTTFIKRDQRRVTAPTALNMMVECAVRQIRLSPYKPAIRRWCPLKYLIPCAQPGQLSGFGVPKCIWMLSGILELSPHERIYQIHRFSSFPSLKQPITNGWKSADSRPGLKE
jgi:hypothetical protein